jgi:hypothetical protein
MRTACLVPRSNLLTILETLFSAYNCTLICEAERGSNVVSLITYSAFSTISISAISFCSLVPAEKAIKSDKKAVSVFRARIYKKLTLCRHHREPKNVTNVEKFPSVCWLSLSVIISYWCHRSPFHVSSFALVSHTQKGQKVKKAKK